MFALAICGGQLTIAEQAVLNTKLTLRTRCPFFRDSCLSLGAIRTSSTPRPTSVCGPERTLALAKQNRRWLLITLGEKQAKIGVEVVRHGRKATFLTADR